MRTTKNHTPTLFTFVCTMVKSKTETMKERARMTARERARMTARVFKLARRWPDTSLDKICSGVNFLGDVKRRFTPKQYKTFLELLSSLKHAGVTAQQVCDQTAIMMEHHTDLMETFMSFLPKL
jgi:histone deacetylase complex regulatory component SIN3